MVEFLFDVLIGFWPFWVGLAVVVAILILLLSSAGLWRSQRTRGTTPNIAPPSSRNPPSLTICKSREPRRMELSSVSEASWRVEATTLAGLVGSLR